MLSWIDWTIIVLYLGGLLYLGYIMGSGQKDAEDYFVGGRSMAWPAVALSAMATQLSANSFISAPGFVGLRQGGGFIWLGYELAVPLAMLVLIFTIYPVFYRAKIVTIYEYLNNRFNSWIRLAVSLVFQITRAVGTGLTIHMTAIVFETAFNLPYIWVVVIVSLITIIYSTMGGIKAVIYADAIQMIIIFVGIFVCGYFAYNLIGGWDAITSHIDTTRLNALDFNEWGYKGQHEFGFWPLLLGGFFLYLSYYGCDQTQSQRLISTKNQKHLNTALFFNGVGRFPMVLAYCTMGILVGTFALMTPDFISQIPKTADGALKADYMLPIFIVNYLPVGIIGTLLVAVLSAAMSSVSSTINSLSAATLKDIIIPYFKPDMPDKQAFRWSIYLTIFWGVICTACVVFSQIAPTVIEGINITGSVVYGSILGIFILGITTKKTESTGCFVGLISGIGFNLYLFNFVPELSWLWYNLTGFVITMAVGYLTSLLLGKTSHSMEALRNLVIIRKALRDPDLKYYAAGLLIAFGVIILISMNIANIFVGQA